MVDYDIAEAIKRIEDDLIASMIRNLDHHRAEETKEGFNWEQWQVKQLAALEKYKKDNLKQYEGQFADINSRIDGLIWAQRDAGNAEQEVAILKAIKDGAKLKKAAEIKGEFFVKNTRMLNALIQATTDDFQKAEYAMLRMTNDQYRKIIYNAQFYAASGAGTYEKAVDMATKDFLKAGINCVQYKNGARHTLSDYVGMAIRTAKKRAYLTGEGEMRMRWGVATVIMNKRAKPCPKCLPFVGKILIDDVWSGGTAEDGSYPLMSSAIEAGLYHPNCKDSHTTYFPGISAPPDDQFTKVEIRDIEEQNRQEAKRQYAERQAAQFDRLAQHSLDDDNKKKYEVKCKEWRDKCIQKYSITRDMMQSREDTPKRMKDLVEKYSSDEFIVVDDSAEYAFAYNDEMDAIIINPQHNQYSYYNQKEVMVHEIAHRIDQYEFGSPMNIEFSKEIKRTEEKLLKNIDKYQKLFALGGRLEYNSIISDIVGCITDNKLVGAYHHESQYIGIPGNAEMEIFADIFSALYQGDDDTVYFLKTEMKELYEAFLHIMEG